MKSMSIRRCPYCGQSGKVADSTIGRTVRCPGCKRAFRTDEEDERAPQPVSAFVREGLLKGERVVYVRPGDRAAALRKRGVLHRVNMFGKRSVCIDLSRDEGCELLLRARVPPASLAPQLRAVVAALDPELPVSGVRTMDDVMAAWPVDPARGLIDVRPSCRKELS